MNSQSIAAAAIAASGLLVTAVASAQEKDQPTHSDQQKTRDLAPATHALELTIGTGYAQGFGDIAGGRASLTDIGEAGGEVQVGVGYRLIPQLTLGVYGTGATFARGGQVDGSSNLYSASAGVQADWHFLPARHELDPWVSLGTGWRGYWVNADQGNTSMQGLELAKFQVGVDYRISKAISISPVIGADMSLFLTESTPTSNGFANIASPKVNSFVSAGILGRFDIPTGSAEAEVATR
jgi:hypothetical protein